VKIFFDENFSPHLAKGFACFQNGRKSENIEVLHVVPVFGRGAPDEEWIPGIAKMHAVAITQDLNIYRIRLLSDLFKSYKIGIFFFHPPKKSSYNYWQWIRKVFDSWDEIKKLAKNSSRPFCYEIRPRSIKPIKL